MDHNTEWLPRRPGPGHALQQLEAVLGSVHPPRHNFRFHIRLHAREPQVPHAGNSEPKVYHVSCNTLCHDSGSVPGHLVLN